MKNVFIHKSACIDDDVIIGEKTEVWHFSHIMTGAKIGKGCTIGQNVFVGCNVIIGDGVKLQNNVYICEGVTLEDSVFCGPTTTFTNVKRPRSEFPTPRTEYLKTWVKRGVTIGANVVIIGGLTLNEYCFVGAGAVVTKDVSPHTIVYGNPAIPQGSICQCGEPLVKFEAHKMMCSACGRMYKKRKNGLSAIS